MSAPPVIGVLGPLVVRAPGRVSDDGQRAAVAVPGSRLRALLTRLAVDADRPVSVAALVDAVWPTGPPVESTNAVQALVSRLRRALGPVAELVSDAGGYRLRLPPESVDLTLFTRLTGTGSRKLSAGDLAAARTDLTDALALWRGVPLPDAGDAEYAVPLVSALNERHVSAWSERIEIDLRRGDAPLVVVELEELVARHPLRESLTSQLMRALAGSGRSADALHAFERLRSRLAQELGTDPGPAVRDVHLAVLRGEAERRADRSDRGRGAVDDAPVAPVGIATPVAQTPRTNLRERRTSFLGREGEMARVDAELAAGRLVTVVGPGGAGKTRLASELGRRRLPLSPDGVWLVELAPVTDPAAVVTAFLTTLGLLDSRTMDPRRGEQPRDTLGHLVRSLTGAEALLIVDNCEHVIDEVAVVVDEVLARCPGIRVLATSREPLAIEGETLCPLSPLPLPAGVSSAAVTNAGSASDDGVGDLLASPAVRLFVERARAVRSDVRLDARTAGPVADIVRRLDGLPLAIELAAARLRGMTVDELAERLTDRFAVLNGGSRTALPRHRTLRSVVEWSWDLLSPPERRLAEWFSVFPGGATAAAATSVCAEQGTAPDTVPDLIAALVEKSLLLMETAEDGPPRYRMLETIREFGRDRLVGRGELSAAEHAHAVHFAGRVAALDPVLRTADQLVALAELRAERANVLAAIRWLGDSPDPDVRSQALDLVLSLLWFWLLTGANVEANRWSTFVLERTRGQDLPGRTWVEAMAVMLAISENTSEPWSVMRERLREVGAGLVGLVPPVPALRVLTPTLLWFAGEGERAADLTAVLVDDPDPWLRAAARLSRAGSAENEGDIDGLREHVAVAAVDFEELGDRWGLASTLISQGYVHTLDGRLHDALASYERAARLSAELGSTEDSMLLAIRRAAVLLRLGQPEAAEAEITREEAGATNPEDFRLFVTSVRLQIRHAVGDDAAADVLLTELRQQLERPVGYLGGHIIALVAATCAAIGRRRGDRATALADAALAYRMALETRDMPIVATVGEAVAAVAADPLDPRGDETAAEIVGAATRVRGALDRGDPLLALLLDELRARLGADRLAEHLRRGRALDRDEAIDRLDPRHLRPPSAL